jgi:hypothetical protein
MAKPFDIRERAFVFACNSFERFQQNGLSNHRRGVSGRKRSPLAPQGAHLEEADAASSRTHFISLNRGALREAREVRFWLRLIVATKLRNHERVPPLAVRIVSAIVKRASKRRRDAE